MLGRGLRRGLGASTPSWILRGAAIDLNFESNRYYKGLLTNLSIIRASVGYAENLDGTLTSFGSGELRRTDRGLLIEEARTNVVLWNRDLTNAAWTKSNVTAAKDQIGVDGVAASASSLTATAANGTVLQAITLASSARFQSAFVKRLTGTGPVEMTMDNGSTWTAIVLTSSYQQLSIPTQTLANPTVGFRIVTSGDAIAVDFVQNENSGAFKTTPISTTTVAVARAHDAISIIGAASALLNGSAGSVIVLTEALPAAVITTNNPYLFANTNSNFTAQIVTTTSFRSLVAAGSSVTATVGASASYAASAIKTGISWSASGRSLVANDGTVTTHAAPPAQDGTVFRLGGLPVPGTQLLNGFIRRLTLWNSRLPDATLKALTV